MRRFLSLAAVLVLSPTVHAQVFSLYGAFTPTHISGAINGGTTSAPTTTSYWASGGGGGVTFGVLPIGPVHLSFDLRGSTKPGANGTDMILAGPRLAVKLPLLRIKPYVAAEGGYLRTRTLFGTSSPFTGQTFTKSQGAWEVLGGADYPLLPLLDFRVIELGGGKAYDLDGSDSVSLFTVSTGLVLHF